MIKKFILIFVLSFSSIFFGDVKAEFGDADFPIGLFEDGPKSYHDAWCRKIKNECRVRFQGKAMWVEGQGGIELNQFISYKYDVDGNAINPGNTSPKATIEIPEVSIVTPNVFDTKLTEDVDITSYCLL